MSVVFLQQIDVWFWIALITSLLIFAWFLFRFRSNKKLVFIYSIRFLVVMTLVLLILQPIFSWIEEFHNELHWNFYIDKSISMGYHQSVSRDSYLEGINAMLSEVKNQEINHNIYTFDHKIYHVNTVDDLDGGATDLEIIFNHIQSEKDQISNAVIFSDGQITKGRKEGFKYENISVPVHVIGIGDTTPLIDIAIQSIEAPTLVIKGEEVNIDVSIMSVGKINDRLRVSLADENQLMAAKYVQIKGGSSTAKLHFKIIPEQLGLNNYIVKTSMLEDEINIKNNQQSFRVHVLKDKYQVALVTGSANFNTGAIKRILKNMPRVELDHFVQLNDNFKPSIEEFWRKRYDLIIFDNFPTQPLSKNWQEILAKKIMSHQSSLFLFAGASTDPNSFKSIQSLFHVDLAEERKISEELPWYWAKEQDLISFDDINLDINLPPMQMALWVAPQTKQTVMAYYEKSEIPLLILGEESKLRYGIWTSPDFATGVNKLSGLGYEKYFNDIFMKIFAWTTKADIEEKLYFRLDKDSYQQGEQIKISGKRFQDESKIISNTFGFVILKNEEQEESKHEMNYEPLKKLWIAEIMAGKPGNYSYEIIFENDNHRQNQTGTFTVVESQVELNNVSMNRDLLQQIVLKTGGKYFSWNTRADILKLLGQEQTTELVVKNSKMNENIYLVLILTLILTIEWIVRRFIGLY